MRRKNFCEYGPVCYQISLWKECGKRNIKDFFSENRFSRQIVCESLPVIIKSHQSVIIRPLEGVDIRLQENKAQNLRLATARMDGIVIKPGEVFSFWKMVGKTTARKGYLPGLTITNGGLGEDIGGGLCQLANMIHWLVLHSPLTVTERHHHTDAIFPDVRRRVPFGTGTSIFYNNVDYRFQNKTDQDVQLRLWVDDQCLNGELRAAEAFAWKYRIEEEDHHFSKEGENYYRNSRIYRVVLDRATGQEVRKELLLKNHSKVLYDHSLIPTEQIRGEKNQNVS